MLTFMGVFGKKKNHCETAYWDVNGRLPCAYEHTEISTNLFYIVTLRICSMICIVPSLKHSLSGLTAIICNCQGF